MVTASEMGKNGGQAKSEAKTAAARKNASKPRGKWMTVIAYEGQTEDGRKHFGVFTRAGRRDSGSEASHDALCADAKAWGWVELRTIARFVRVG